MKRGMRIYYDTEDGNIIHLTGEVEGEGVLPHKEEQTVGYIDLPYGAYDYMKTMIVGVDVETGKPIIETFNNETENERRIRELEDALLMQAENDIGGIL